MGNSTPSISIHALRGEGDHKGSDKPLGRLAFLSTPSAGRATRRRVVVGRWVGHFYPRPPRGGRRETPLRTSRDRTFLSTPSAGRATTPPRKHFRPLKISIHALRGEGDTTAKRLSLSTSYFYPRPPRGGRLQCAPRRRVACAISIHALRGEGDTHPVRSCYLQQHFYPRPPRGGRRLVSGPG